MATYEHPGGRAGHSINEAERKRRKEAKRHMRQAARPDNELTETPSVPKSVNEKIIVDLLPSGPRVTIIPLGGRKFDSGRRE